MIVRIPLLISDQQPQTGQISVQDGEMSPEHWVRPIRHEEETVFNNLLLVRQKPVPVAADDAFHSLFDGLWSLGIQIDAMAVPWPIVHGHKHLEDSYLVMEEVGVGDGKVIGHFHALHRGYGWDHVEIVFAVFRPLDDLLLSPKLPILLT